jgi:putative endonuclease
LECWSDGLKNNTLPIHCSLIKSGMSAHVSTIWSVYILRCRDGTFYTGIAKNVQARIDQHNRGRGAAYTRGRLPVTLVYEENTLTHSEALVREAEIKRLSRAGKEELVLPAIPR